VAEGRGKQTGVRKGRAKRTRGRALDVLTQAQADAILADTKFEKQCERDGVDLGMLLENLMATPEERFARHENALKMALAFRKAGEEARNK
jgi:hypothetical protein